MPYETASDIGPMDLMLTGDDGDSDANVLSTRRVFDGDRKKYTSVRLDIRGGIGVDFRDFIFDVSVVTHGLQCVTCGQAFLLL